MITGVVLPRAACVAAGLLLLAAGGCGREPAPEAELAAVYEAFLEIPGQEFADRVLLQDSTMPVAAGAFADAPPASQHEISPVFSPEVREAIRDLVARSRTPVRLPAELQVVSGGAHLTR